MSLSEGTRLGPYEILAPIGSGGMGEVYRARDTRLGREVALKVVDEQFTGRFQREAESISALNHPHICTLYDVGPSYLVMELVEGVSLDAMLRKGPLALDLVARYGQQIAAALAAAHARGIIHRDLKPGNIMVTKAGTKVLDFGLAKRDSRRGAQTDETITASKVIVGTPAYISPEQLEGKEADPRVDIFALGVVLYEMAAGKRPFHGASQAALIGEILHAEPPSIPHAPSRFNHIVQRCLAKDPDERWQSASDVGAELRWAMSADSPDTGTPSRKRAKWITVASLVAGLLAGIAGTTLALRPQAPTSVYRFALAPPPGAEFLNVPNRSGLALSPDGSTIVFLAARNGQSRLWIQRLNSQSALELPGTENASVPFWSPDGRSLGFFAGNRLQRIDADGANRQTLAETHAPRGGTWGPDGTILFTPNNLDGTPLYRISASGGEAAPFTTVVKGKDRYHNMPQFLWGSRQFLFGTLPGYAVASLDNPKERKDFELASTRVSAVRVDARDYLFWVREETIVCQRWDAKSARTDGEPIPISGPSAGLPESFTVSNSGILVHSGRSSLQLQWMDRTGQVLSPAGEPFRALSSPAISSDARIAATRPDGIAVTDLKRGVTTLVLRGSAGPVVWSPDGTRLAASRNGKLTILEPGGKETALPTDSSRVVAWPAPGRSILYQKPRPDGKRTIYLATVDSPADARPILATSSDESHAAISSNGEWIAYSTDESGRFEVYLRKLAGGPRVQVSVEGGTTPIWRKDGRELFYESSDGSVIAVGVNLSGDHAVLSPPTALFALPARYVGGHSFDVTPDGQRFLVIAPYRPAPREPLYVVVNWPALLPK